MGDKDENVRFAVWCGGSAMSEGETHILADTERHVAMLSVSGWGNITKEGRPNRPRATYRWLWRVPHSNIAYLNLYPDPKNGRGWVLEITPSKGGKGKAFE